MDRYRSEDQRKHHRRWSSSELQAEPSGVRKPVASLHPWNGGRRLAWEMTLQGVGPAALVLGILYLGLAVVSLVFLPHLAWILAPVALLTSGLLLALHIVLRRVCWLRLSPHLLAGLVASSVLVNSLLRLVLARDPLQTINLILLLVGAGFLFLSSRLLLLLIGITLTSWSAAVVFVAGGAALLEATSWRHFGFGLIAAAGLGIILQITRVRGYQHLEHLRQETELQAERERQRAAHLETLISVGHSINGFLNLDALLDHAVKTIHACFGYDHVGVFLIDEGRTQLVARAGTGDVGQWMVTQRFSLEVDGPGFVRWAATHREPACCNDVEEDARYYKVDFFPTTRSEMTLPLETGDTLLGVLDIQSVRRNAFSEEDLRVCRSLASQIASAIVNASRYEAEHARRALAESLYTVGRALSQTLDVSEVLDLILDSLGRLVPFDRGAVLLERQGMLDIVTARGFPADSNPLEIRVPIREGDVYAQIHAAKAPLIIPELDDRSDWEYVSGLPRARSWAGLPLTDAKDDVIGMLSLARQDLIPFTGDEVALGAALAGQAGVALHNARVYMELSAAYRQLSRLDRAKSDFISLASHELRTPLTLVTGYGQMLADEALVRSNPDISRLANGLVEGSTRLQEIVERMMDLAEIDNQLLCLTFAPVPLDSLLQEAVSGFAEALSERKLRVRIDDVSPNPLVDIDRAALVKALRHLLVNAVKFTPDGGEIRISSIVHGPAEDGARDASIEIIVRDTGIGIDPSEQERIFDKFYQIGEIGLHSSGSVKFRGGGPGLGLAIVKGIVEAHHGSVWVESPGYDADAYPGSAFHVRLPLHQQDLALHLNVAPLLPEDKLELPVN
jgi:signal transduction histidine kinase/putative methionine-R-sulfoxide reductase with GAF domain